MTETPCSQPVPMRSTWTLAGAPLDAVATKDAETKEARRAKASAFFQRRGRKGGRTAGGNGDGGKTRSRALIQRLEAARLRNDTRAWVVQRRERTRHLIELGGLVQKAGLVELADDDRATIYGALLELASKARTDDAGDLLALWKQRGKRAFDAETEATEKGDGIPGY